MFLLVPAYPGCPGLKAVKRSSLNGRKEDIIKNQRPMVLILNRSLRICGHCQHVSCNALTVTALHCLVLYDTRCYFNVRSKADMSQLNLYQRRNDN